MIRCTLSLLTAIAVLWHATAGCCAHHDHAESNAAKTIRLCACGGEQVLRSTESASDGRVHDSARKAFVAELHEPYDAHDDVCHERCSFPQPEGSGVSLVKQTLASCDLALPVATLLYAFEATPANDPPAVETPPPPHAGGALRRHLAVGVLLI